MRNAVGRTTRRSVEEKAIQTRFACQSTSSAFPDGSKYIRHKATEYIYGVHMPAVLLQEQMASAERMQMYRRLYS